MSIPSETGLSASPYPGLRPFRRDEADIFFGREEQVDQLLGKLEDCRFLAVVGTSGCGKSSLVRAGMLSALEGGFLASAGPRWHIAEMRPGNQPLANLAHALSDSDVLGEQWSTQADAKGFLTASLRRGPLGLVELLREPLVPERNNLLLLVDQFEEIFRFHTHGDSNEAAAFVDLLLASVGQQEVPVYVVITMRSDFLGDCSIFTGLPEAINVGQFLIPRLTRDQCHASIAGPAAVFEGQVEPELVNRILNDIGTDPDQLPLMQHALMRVWSLATQRAMHGGGGTADTDYPDERQILLTAAEYDEIGGLKQALSNHCDELYETLDTQQQRVAEILCRCLSERGADQRDTRRPVPLQTVAEVAEVSPDTVADIVDIFRQPDCCFLTPPIGVPLGSETILDISHESFIRQWSRMRQWVMAEADSAAVYRRLSETSKLWKADKAAVWTTPDLEIALAWRNRENPSAAWARRYGGNFDETIEFLDASIAVQKAKEFEEEVRQARELEMLQHMAESEKERADEAEKQQVKERQANSRLRTRAIISMIAGIAAIVLAVLAYISSQHAENQRLEAESAKTTAVLAQRNAEGARSQAENARETAVTALQQAERSRKARAQSQVSQLLEANPNAISSIIQRLKPDLAELMPQLRELYEKPELPERQRIRLNLILLESDDVHGQRVSYLRDKMLTVQPDEFLVIRGALESYAKEFADELWAIVEDAEAPVERRFRTACALAAYDPDNERWVQLSSEVADRLVSVNPVFLAQWIDALHPVKQRLLDPLSEIFRDQKAENSTKRTIAATILADFASDDPRALTDLLLDANEDQFVVLFPELEQHAEAAIPLLNGVLQQEIVFDWQDAPLDANWIKPAQEIVDKIKGADGLIAERFAICQTMPLDEFLRVADELRNSGYRPLQFRPFPIGKSKSIHIVAVWKRDGRDWKLAHNASAETIRERDSELGEQGFRPMDVYSYLGYKSGSNEKSTDDAAAETPFFSALWIRKSDDSEIKSEMHVGVPSDQSSNVYEQHRQSGFDLSTYSEITGADEVKRFSGVWSKTKGQTQSAYYGVSRAEPEYTGDILRAMLQVDVHVWKTPKPDSTQERYAKQLAQAQGQVKAKPNDPAARYSRAIANFQLGNDKNAIPDFTFHAEKEPKGQALYYRAISHARLGNLEDARIDLAQYLGSESYVNSKAFCDAVVSAYTEDDVEGMKRLESFVARQARNSSSFLINPAACAYAMASKAFEGKDPAKQDAYARRAVDFIRKAIGRDYTGNNTLQTEPFLDPIRNHPGFVAILNKRKVDRQYYALWHGSDQFVSTEIHGLNPHDHIARIRELVADGYRPASISAAETEAGLAPITASVWHRPFESEESKETLALRQANCAVALLRLGIVQTAWPLLKQQTDSRLRSHLIHRLGPMQADFEVVAARLMVEDDDSIRQALILSLGEFPVNERSVHDETLNSHLLGLYRDDPDPGIHSAAEWTLRQWLPRDELERLNEEFRMTRQEDPQAIRRWYVNGQGHTMVVFSNSSEFLTGSPGNEPGRSTRERLYKRHIPRSFAVATKEVTVEHFQRFLRENRKIRQTFDLSMSPEPTCPHNQVQWLHAAAYCNWLSRTEGIPRDEWCYLPDSSGGYSTSMQLAPDYLKRTGYRLPTNAEWEYACRAGTVTSRFYGQSEKLLGKYAWYSRNGNSRTHPVGSLKPNDAGLFDMLGNIQEHCSPAKTQKADGSVTDDVEQPISYLSSSQFPLRGGAAFRVPSQIRVAPAFRIGVAATNSEIGFRVARTFPCRLETEVVDRRIKESPDDVDLFVRRAQAYEKLGEPEKAIVQYRKAINLKPNSPELWSRRGQCQSRIGTVEDDRHLPPDWSDSPLDTGIPKISMEIRNKIANARGLLTERFALCQTMPLDEFINVTDQLRPAGYRPIRFRPFSAGDETSVAAVWTRDGKEWQITYRMKAEEIREQLTEQKENGLVIDDLAAWSAKNDKGELIERYAVLWRKSDDPSSQFDFYAGVTQTREYTVWRPLREKEFVPLRRQIIRVKDGQEHSNVVLWKSHMAPSRYGNPTEWDSAFAVHALQYEEYLSNGKLQIDVDVCNSTNVDRRRDQLVKQLTAAESVLVARPDDSGARLRKAESHLWLGATDQALEELSKLIKKTPDRIRPYRFRAIANARIGKADEAHKDLARHNRTAKPHEKMYLDAVVSVSLGQHQEGMQQLEAVLQEHATDTDWLYDAACAYSIASSTMTKDDSKKADEYADRAVELLRNAFDFGYRNYSRLTTDPHFAVLENHPWFLKATIQYAGLWYRNSQYLSQELHGLSPDEHQKRMTGLVAVGYRPVAISVAPALNDKTLIGASVWHRPLRMIKKSDDVRTSKAVSD